MRKRRNGLLAIAAALLVGAGGAACSVEDVVVAREVGGGGAGPCSDSRDCDPIAFCVKASCTATQGHCELRPANCDEQPPRTTCGCDGVNYWNDCLRRQNGVAASTDGECTSQFASCGRTPCPTVNARCARLVPTPGAPCDPGMPGVCWVLPPRCPPDDGGGLWESCGARPPTPACMNLCEAIRDERPARLAGGPFPSCP